MTRESFTDSLREHRELCSLSLDDISRITKIPRPSLEHLEAGRFESLPGDVFVRGFLRSYAQCLGLNSAELIEDYERCGGRPLTVVESAMEITKPNHTPSVRKRALPERRAAATRTRARFSPPQFAVSTRLRGPLMVWVVGILLAVGVGVAAVVLQPIDHVPSVITGAAANASQGTSTSPASGPK